MHGLVPSPTPARSLRSEPAVVLDPGGRVVVSVHPSGAIGRLVPDDVIGPTRYHREHVAG